MRSQGYDAMSDELKQLIEDTTYDLNHSADKRLEVINTMLDKEVGSYIQAFNKINSVISNTGFVGITVWCIYHQEQCNTISIII